MNLHDVRQLQSIDSDVYLLSDSEGFCLLKVQFLRRSSDADVDDP